MWTRTRRLDVAEASGVLPRFADTALVPKALEGLVLIRPAVVGERVAVGAGPRDRGSREPGYDHLSVTRYAADENAPFSARSNLIGLRSIIPAVPPPDESNLGRVVRGIQRF